MSVQEPPLSVEPLTSEPPKRRRANPLPEGTLEVAVGLLIAGVSAYAFLLVSKRMLGTHGYGPLGVVWAVIFTMAPGFFLPLEQEVSRAMAARRTQGVGSGPLLRRAASLGAGILGVLLVLILATSPILVDKLLSGQWLLLLGVVLGLVGYFAGHLARGVVSGLGRFRPYSVYIGGEALVRLALCLGFAAVGVRTAGWYGVALGVAPIVAVAVAMRGQRGIVTPGPDAPWSELSTSLGALLAGSALAQALLNAGVPAMHILASDAESERVGAFFSAVVVARLPLFLFQAVQAALLPKLTALAEQGNLAEFKSGFRKLIVVVSIVGVLGVVGTLVLGPLVIEIAFDVEMGRRDLALLAAGSGLYMVALTIAQALIALRGQRDVAISWTVAVGAFIASLPLMASADLYLRVEAALLVGSVAGLAVMVWFMLRRISGGAVIGTGELITAIHDVPLTP